MTIRLCEVPALAWVKPIDVEQALCEFSKYEKYREKGISHHKRFLMSDNDLPMRDNDRL